MWGGGDVVVEASLHCTLHVPRTVVARHAEPSTGGTEGVRGGKVPAGPRVAAVGNGSWGGGH